MASPSKPGVAKQPSASDFFDDDNKARSADGAHEAWVVRHKGELNKASLAMGARKWKAGASAVEAS